VAALALGLLAFFFRGAPGEVHHYPLAGLTFVPLTLAGLLVGRGLEVGPPERQFVRRAAAAAVAGVGWSAAAQAAGVPFNKALGTSSFVAIATAASAALLLATAALERAGVPSRLARRRRRPTRSPPGCCSTCSSTTLHGSSSGGGGASRSCPHGGRGRRARGALALSIAARAAGLPHPI